MSKSYDGDSLNVNSADLDNEQLIRRFIRKVKDSGLMKELSDRRFYEKPSVKRRKKMMKNKSLTNKT